MMRVAHLIMTYKNPTQLERLIRRLYHPNFDIYVHLDKKIDEQDFMYLKNIDRVYFIVNRVLCNWGGFSFVNAIISSMKEILSKDKDYEFINLMSAQDYPIKNNNVFYDCLNKHLGHSFIAYEEQGKSDWWQHAESRFASYHFTDINIKGRYFVQRILNKIGPKRKFPITCLLYGSAVATWWTLSTDCVKYIVSYLDVNHKLTRFMKYTWGADEFLFPTIIMNSPFKELTINNNLRYIEWEEGKSNPRIFNSSDLDSLKQSSKFFARKFDTTIDTQILDEIDCFIDNNH